MTKNVENSLLLRTRLLAKKNLIDKYSIDDKQYRIKILDQILFNENTHLVTRFKDYLIFDDNNEFINKFYGLRDIEVVLPFILEYYINYSKINPSFILNKQGKMLHKNFQRKQKFYLSKHKTKDTENENPIGNSNILKSKYLKTFDKEDYIASEILRASIFNLSNLNSQQEHFHHGKTFFEDSFLNNGDNFLQQSSMKSYLYKQNPSFSNKLSNIDFYTEEEKMEKEINNTFEKPNFNDYSVSIKNQGISNRITQANMNLNNFTKKHSNNATLRNIHYHKTIIDKSKSKNINIRFDKDRIDKCYNNKFNKKNLLINKQKENANIFYNLKIKLNNNIQNKTSKTLINKGKNACSRVPSFKLENINKIKLHRYYNNPENTTKKINFIDGHDNIVFKKQTEPNTLLNGILNKNNFYSKNNKKNQPSTKNTHNHKNYFSNCDYNYELNNFIIFSDTTTTTTPNNRIFSNESINNKKDKTVVNLKRVSNHLNSEKETQNKIVDINRNNLRSFDSINKSNTKLKSYCSLKKQINLKTKYNFSSNYLSNNNNNNKIDPKVFSEDKTIMKKNQVSNLSEYSKKIDFIMNTVKKLSRNIKKENILLDSHSRNNQNFKINSISKNSNLNNMFSTNSNTVNSEKTQNNNVSGYFDKKLISDGKFKLKLNLIQQEQGINTDRINVDRRFYERFKIEMISIDFNNGRNFQNHKQNLLEKGKTFNIEKSQIKGKFKSDVNFTKNKNYEIVRKKLQDTKLKICK